jgi:hypothetical protein
MKAEDLGYNPDTGSHSAAFSGAEAAMMGILADHIGKEDRIPANQLAWRFFVEMEGQSDDRRFRLEPWKRSVRYMVNHLVIDHDQGIMSKAGIKGGYWLAGNEEEANEFYETFRKRGITGVTKAARGKKNVMVSLVQQLAFDWEDLQAGDRPAMVRPYDYESAPLAVVTSFLDRMTKEPERYDQEIRLLRDKFGKVLMPREAFVRIQTLSKELSGLLAKVS